MYALIMSLFIIGCLLIIIIPQFSRENHISNKSKINFDEFDDIDEIKKQEKKAKENMEFEYNVLKRVADEAADREQDVDKAIEEAKRHLYNFKVLDSVEVGEKKVVEGNSITALKENGNNFDTELFKKWSKQIFQCIKSGKEEQLKIVKHFITEEMYDKLIYQQKRFEQDGLDFVTEDLIIEECKLLDYSKGMSKEEIKIFITAKMKEYIIQKDTKRVIRGNKQTLYKKKIVMTFLKRDIEDKEGVIKNCPNCGAETIQTEFGKCRYCSTLLFPIRYNWTLIDFETM